MPTPLVVTEILKLGGLREAEEETLLPWNRSLFGYLRAMTTGSSSNKQLERQSIELFYETWTRTITKFCDYGGL